MLDGSAEVARSRPFYTDYAAIYDQLVTDPVEPWIDRVAAVIHDLPHCPPPRILDAGCGTGRHAAAMVNRGWRVELLDASPELLAIATARCPMTTVRQTDICSVKPTSSFDVVTCRGVLNDLVAERERNDAVRALAGQLRPGGALILDVRDRDRTRADGTPDRRTVTDPGTGERVRFTTAKSWRGHHLVVCEQHELLTADGGVRDRIEYEFTMRPWTVHELTTKLTAAGMTGMSITPGARQNRDDRLTATARRAHT